MYIALWTVQIVVAVAFLMVGGLKVFAYEKYKAMTAKHSATPGDGPSRNLITLIGLAELAGAVGLILPAATGILPALTTLAALGLAVIMILAIGFHLRRHEPATPAIVLLVLSAFVVAGRILA